MTSPVSPLSLLEGFWERPVHSKVFHIFLLCFRGWNRLSLQRNVTIGVNPKLYLCQTVLETVLAGFRASPAANGIRNDSDQSLRQLAYHKCHFMKCILQVSELDSRHKRGCFPFYGLRTPNPAKSQLSYANIKLCILCFPSFFLIIFGILSHPGRESDSIKLN